MTVQQTNVGSILVALRLLIIMSYIALVKFLPGRREFQLKRNQARQRLADFSHPRFQDLCTDVYYELAKRFPGVKTAVCPLIPLSLCTLVSQILIRRHQPLHRDRPRLYTKETTN
jgi:hypothetical protein